MSLLHDVRIGSQRPRLQSLPADRQGSAGPEAVELASLAGLELDDWQAWCLAEALSEQSDGQWSAFEVGILVSRQCGKGSILEARQLAGLALLGERLQVHTAHEFKTCFEHFLRMVQLCEACPDVDRQIVRIRRGAGEQAIEMRSGARLRFLARSGGSGRGMSGDAVYLDEAFALTQPMLGALLPTLSARPNPQVWYTSSAPLSTSVPLHNVRERAIAGGGARLFFAEWSAPEGTAPTDVDAWYQAVPALGIRISEEAVQAELDAMQGSEGEFLRERLGIPDPLPSTEGPPAKLDAKAWNDSRTASPPTVSPGACTLAYDIHHGWADIAISTGTLAGSYGEVVEHRKGDGWLPERLAELVTTWKPTAVGLDGGNGDAVAVLGRVREHFESVGLDPELIKPLTSAQYKAACGDAESAVLNGLAKRPFVEPDQLQTAGEKAAERRIGDAFVFDRKSATVPLGPLISWTVARSLLAEKTEVKPVFAA
jgi:hypothetical protein